MSARSTLVWTIKYGLPGLGLRIAGRRGELISRLVVDPRPRDDPFPAYDEIRTAGPLVNGRLVSATARYPIANELLRSDIFLAGPTPAPTARLGRVLLAALDPRALGPDDPPSLIAIGGERHARLRKLVSHAFTPRAITALSARVEELAGELLDGIAGRDTVDLVESYAALLPVTVIAEILGVPAGMRGQFLNWTNSAALALEPGLPWRDFRRAYAAIRQSHTWLDRAHRHAAPGSRRRPAQPHDQGRRRVRPAHRHRASRHRAARARRRLRDHGEPDRQRGRAAAGPPPTSSTGSRPSPTAGRGPSRRCSATSHRSR